MIYKVYTFQYDGNQLRYGIDKGYCKGAVHKTSNPCMLAIMKYKQCTE